MKALLRPSSRASSPFEAYKRGWTRYLPERTWWLKLALFLGAAAVAAFLALLGSVSPPLWIMGGFLVLCTAIALPMLSITLSFFMGLAMMSGLTWLPDHRIAELVLALVVAGVWFLAPKGAVQRALSGNSRPVLATGVLIGLGVLLVLYGFLYRAHFRAFIYTDSRCFVFWLMLPTTILLANGWVGWQRFYRALLIFAMVTCLVALFQAATGIKVTYGGALEALQTMDTTYDGIARVAVPGILVVMFCFVLVAGLWAVDRLTWWQAAVPLALYASCIYLNFGRAIWAATALMLLILLVLGGMVVARKLLPAMVVGGVVVVAAAALLAPQMLDAAVQRVLSVQQESGASTSFGWRVTENAYAVEAIRKSPLFGDGMGTEYKPPMLGPGAFPDQTHYVHNGYYFILIKGGAVLLLALVAILLTVLRRAWQVHQSADPVDRVIGSSVVAMVVALFLLNFTQPEFSGSAAALVMSLAYPLLSRHSQPAAG